jgi:hypothetical protein
MNRFIGIGKFLFDTFNAPWSIPHLHFLVDEPCSGHFEATNLEFGLVASGADAEDATQRLAALVHFHITSVMTDGNGYQEFIDTAESDFMNDYWAAYRVIEFTLGKNGKDLSHEIEKRIMRAIQEILDNQIKDMIKQKAKKRADEIIKAYEEATKFKLISVEYKELTAA